MEGTSDLPSFATDEATQIRSLKHLPNTAPDRRPPGERYYGKTGILWIEGFGFCFLIVLSWISAPNATLRKWSR